MSILFVPKAEKFNKITCLPPLVLAMLHKVFSSRFPGFLPVFLPDLLSDNVCAVKRRCPSKRCYGQSGYESWAAGIWFPYLWDSFSSAANWEFVEGSAPRTTLSFRTSPLKWCGNLHRIPGHPSSYRSFYSTVSRNLSTRNCASIQEIATPVCATLSQ